MAISQHCIVDVTSVTLPLCTCLASLHVHHLVTTTYSHVSSYIKLEKLALHYSAATQLMLPCLLRHVYTLSIASNHMYDCESCRARTMMLRGSLGK